MKKLLVLLLAALSCHSPMQNMMAPKTLYPIVETNLVSPLFWVRPEVREQLSRAWDDSTVPQNEKAFCLHYKTSSTNVKGMIAYEVYAADSAEAIGATPNSIWEIGCKDTVGVAILHTHLNQTFYPANLIVGGDSMYIRGGIEARQCWPSVTDYRSLLTSNVPFGVIQCDKESLVPYWKDPFEFVTDTTYLNIQVFPFLWTEKPIGW